MLLGRFSGSDQSPTQPFGSSGSRGRYPMIDEKWRTSDYLIIREPDGVHCYIALDDTSTALLPHRVRHSPDGFEYGYSGSGPSDLARSIVAHFYAVTDADLDT